MGCRSARTVGPGPATPVSVTPSVRRERRRLDQSSGHRRDQRAGRRSSTRPRASCAGSRASIPGVTGQQRHAQRSRRRVTINISTVECDSRAQGDHRHQSGRPGGDERRNPPRDPRGVRHARVARRREQAVSRSTFRAGRSMARPPSGTGVDAVHVYAYPAAGSPVVPRRGDRTACRARTLVRRTARGSPRRDTASSRPRCCPLASTPSWCTGTARWLDSTATASVAVTLTALAPPFGVVDTPGNNMTVSGEVAVTGWALDDAGVASVDIFRSPVASEGTRTDLRRPRGVHSRRAVLTSRRRSRRCRNSDNAGWGFMVLTNMMPNQGNGTFDFYAYAVDHGGMSTLLGTRRLIVAQQRVHLAVRDHRHAAAGRDGLRGRS